MNFGTIDPTRDAEEKLNNLHMKDNQHILKYNIEFNQLSTRVNWGSKALCHCYYKGLPEHIKDVISTQGKPMTLIRIKHIAQAVDACYWEHQHEKMCFKGHSTKSDYHDKSGKKNQSN